MIKIVGRKTKSIIGLMVILAALIIPLLPTVVFAAPADAYWVGDSGNTSDAANHWAIVSGGAPGAGNAPDQTTNIHFDANSFSGAGHTVTLDADLFFLTMNWTGATNNPTLDTDGFILRAYGDVTFIPPAGMTLTGNPATSRLGFHGAGDAILTTAGQSISGVLWAHPGFTGTLTLADTVTSTGVNTQGGIFNSANRTISTGQFISDGASAKTITLGSSTVNVTYWEASGTLPTLTANTSTINDSGNFAGGGLATYNTVNLTGAASTITGSNTFATLALPSGTTQTITFTDGTTQTATTFTLSGSAGNVHTLQGSGVGGWNLSDAAGTNNADYISISRSTAAGGATFNANGASVNGGNNVGWNFPLTTSTQAATGVAMTAAGVTSGTFNGTLTDMGGANDTVWFEYGLTVAYGTDTAHVAAVAPGAFTAAIPAALTPGATYHYRSVMNNGVDTANGADQTFTFTLPTISAGTQTQTGTSATLASSVTNMGVASSDYVYFQWGGTPALGSATATQTVVGAGAFSATLTGLTPGNLYYFRPVSQVGSVYTYGSTQSFSFIGTTTNNIAVAVVAVAGVVVVIAMLFALAGGISIGTIVLVIVSGLAGIMVIGLLEAVISSLW